MYMKYIKQTDSLRVKTFINVHLDGKKDNRALKM